MPNPGPVARDTGLRFFFAGDGGLMALYRVDGEPGLYRIRDGADAARPRPDGGMLARLGDNVIDLERAHAAEAAARAAIESIGAPAATTNAAQIVEPELEPE